MYSEVDAVNISIAINARFDGQNAYAQVERAIASDERQHASFLEELEMLAAEEESEEVMDQIDEINAKCEVLEKKIAESKVELENKDNDIRKIDMVLASLYAKYDNVPLVEKVPVSAEQEPDSLEDAMVKIIKSKKKFIKANKVHFLVTTDYPKFKNTLQRAVTTSLFRLKRKKQLDVEKIGESNKKAYWGLPDWKDAKGNIKPEYMYDV